MIDGLAQRDIGKMAGKFLKDRDRQIIDGFRARFSIDVPVEKTEYQLMAMCRRQDTERFNQNNTIQ